MQDGYVADGGDFGKYALLRGLCNISHSEPGPSYRLGVVWYYVDGNAIGKRIHYEKYERCDPHLYEKLQRIRREDRSVANVERSLILGGGTKFYRVPLNHKRKGAKARDEDRGRWLERAVSSMKGCQVVFLDPDNGLNPGSVEKHHIKGQLHAFFDEVARFIKRGQSVIIYQHQEHRGTTRGQIGRTLRQLDRIAPSRSRPFAVWCHIGSARMYFIVPSRRLHRTLRSRATRMVNGGWSGAFEPKIYNLA